MHPYLFHGRRLVLSQLAEKALRFKAARIDRNLPAIPASTEASQSFKPDNPSKPEDYRPLEHACFQDPYDFYKMLRDQAPVYELPNGVVCISRHQDIVDLSRDVAAFSSTNQGAIASLKKGQSVEKIGAMYSRMADLGLTPADVLATADQPQHTTDRKVGHGGLNARFVKSLEGEVEGLCQEMMEPFMKSGKVEFMQEFGWRLPMVLIIKLLGLPVEDFEKIKTWCVDTINTQSGVTRGSEMTRGQASVLAFVRYCWKHFLLAKKHPQENLLGMLVKATQNPEMEFEEKTAVSAIFQLLVAGSDSSATSMGNALKLLIENPDLHEEIKSDIDNKLNAFVEEVFRLESAFQGHFRWSTQERELHGVTLPRGSRIFLMWASGNRDERYWEEPNKIDLNRKNGKKHLTFGHGIHACIGRELARMEIRIVLKEFLTKTENIKIDGETPFIASMFARTLVKLPISFDYVGNTNISGREQAA